MAMRNPRINPRPGDRLAKVLTNRARVSGVFSRTVLALEKHFPDSVVVVWTRKRRNRPCPLHANRMASMGQDLQSGRMIVPK